MKEKVEANAELGLLSKKLATILLDCPVDFNAEEFYVSKPNTEDVTTLFQELEFRRLQTTFEKIYGLTTTSAPEKTSAEKPSSTEKRYQYSKRFPILSFWW